MAKKWQSQENLTPEEIIRQIDMEFGSLDDIPARIAREAAFEKAQENKKQVSPEKSGSNSNTISIEEMRRKYKKNYAETYGDGEKTQNEVKKDDPKEEALPNRSIEELEKSLQDALKEDDFGEDAQFIQEVAAAEYMTPLTEEEKEEERRKTMRSWQLITGFAFSFAIKIFFLGYVVGGWLDRNYFGDKGYASMFMILFSIVYSFYFLYRDCMKINAK